MLFSNGAEVCFCFGKREFLMVVVVVISVSIVIMDEQVWFLCQEEDGKERKHLQHCFHLFLT